MSNHPAGPAILDLMADRSFSELADALRARVGQITAQWEASIRQLLPKADTLTLRQLQNHLPVVLNNLARALASNQPQNMRVLLEQPTHHAEMRYHQEYSIQELIIEYRLLRQILVVQVEGQLRRRLSTAEDVALDVGIDAILQESVIQFVEHQKRQLQAATEAEAKFLAYVSHDLRNNLNGVVLSLDMMRYRMAQSPQFAEDVEEIESAKQLILDTIDGMERMLRAERLRAKPQPKAEVVDLAAVAAEVAKRFAYQAKRKGVGLQIAIPTEARIHSDREWIALVLQNLVNNAVKYSRRGVVRIAAERRSGSPGWVLSVSDEGPGIAPEQLQRIFTAFERGNTHGQAGVGLGLAIASEATRLLGAELTVDSKVGVGSTFRLALPETIGGTSSPYGR